MQNDESINKTSTVLCSKYVYYHSIFPITFLFALIKSKEAICGLNTVDLNDDAIKILGAQFSFNKEIQKYNNYLSTVKNIQEVSH